MSEQPTIKQINDYLSAYGKRGANTLNILGKLNHFIQAINHPIGKELLKDDIDRHEELLIKLYEETASEQEKAELRYLKHRLKKIAERISEYIKKTNEVMSSVSDERRAS